MFYLFFGDISQAIKFTMGTFLWQLINKYTRSQYENRNKIEWKIEKKNLIKTAVGVDDFYFPLDSTHWFLTCIDMTL